LAPANATAVNPYNHLYWLGQQLGSTLIADLYNATEGWSNHADIDLLSKNEPIQPFTQSWLGQTLGNPLVAGLYNATEGWSL